MAKNSFVLRTVLEILREVFKLPRRNKKIFLFIILFTIISYLVLFLAFVYGLMSFITDLSTDSVLFAGMDPKSPEYSKQLYKTIQDTAAPLILIEIIFVFFVSVVSLVSTVATIYVSAMRYLEKNLTLKALILKVKRIWIRAVITGFCSCLLAAGLLVFEVPILIVMVLAWNGSIIITAIGIVLTLVGIIINNYLLLALMLSLVISVLEDCYGLQALAKAEEFIKGRKVVGLVLTVGYMGLSSVIAVLPLTVTNSQTPTVGLLIMFVMPILGIVVKMLATMSYTVFYFNCKESVGEQVEVEEELGYSVVSTIPLVGVHHP